MTSSTETIVIEIDVTGSPLPAKMLHGRFTIHLSELPDTTPASIAEAVLNGMNRAGRALRDAIDPEYHDRLVAEMEADRL